MKIKRDFQIWKFWKFWTTRKQKKKLEKAIEEDGDKIMSAYDDMIILGHVQLNINDKEIIMMPRNHGKRFVREVIEELENTDDVEDDS